MVERVDDVVVDAEVFERLGVGEVGVECASEVEGVGDSACEDGVELEAERFVGKVVGVVYPGGGAVVADDAVEAGGVLEVVGCGAEGEEEGSHPEWVVSCGEGVHFVAAVCALADAVAFGLEDIDEFEVVESSRDDAVFFALLSAGFDGEEQAALGREVEAEHGVGHEVGGAEGFEDELDALEVGEFVGAGFPCGSG